MISNQILQFILLQSCTKQHLHLFLIYLAKGICAYTSCFFVLFLTSRTWVGYPSISHYLCEEDPEGPYIRFDSECAKVDGLWSCPFDGKFGTWLSEEE